MHIPPALSRWRPALCCAFAFAALALLPGLAPAATVSSRPLIDLSESADVAVTAITLVGDPSEGSRLIVRYVPSGVTFSDDTNALQAGANCTQVAPGEVTCALLPQTADLDTTLDLRDGDDRATLLLGTAPQQPGSSPSRSFQVLAGDGPDLIVTDATTRDGLWIDGGAGADRLVGGGGPDTLAGGSGADELFGLAGADTLAGDRLRPVTAPSSTPGDSPADTGPDGDDAIDGGDGLDVVSYTGREAGVTVDLATKTGGTPGTDADRFTAVEGALGTEAADVLRGDAGPNELDGQEGGRDTVEGRGGDDNLTGEEGVFRGGSGDDFISPLNGRAVCGSGDDFLNPFGAYSDDGSSRPRPIPASCERTSLFNGELEVPVLTAGRFALLHITASERKLDAGSLTLLRGGRVLGRIARLAPRRTSAAGRTYRMRLTAAGRRAAARGRMVELRYAFRTGGRFTLRTRLRLGGGGCFDRARAQPRCVGPSGS